MKAPVHKSNKIQVLNMNDDKMHVNLATDTNENDLEEYNTNGNIADTHGNINLDGTAEM
jgi:hypothetical protein